ncbi:H/ACA ribonucleoprotein complex subunit 1 [Puccinia sorghi]|uniref:H/ACA ribonucleoprotein complex subunit n=1 Tax=Puccinia sorghi TaxID=27349 RepID=A0A0L6UD60_9BASI|nr:H/ACA ribonucleoprotein complex subunit 1 [Puccinia sorghi]
MSGRGRGFSDRGARGRGGGGGFRGARGGFGGGFDNGPPAEVLVEGEMLCTSTNGSKVPYFNAPIYLANKTTIGKVDEILGPINEVYFTIKMGEGMLASSFSPGDKVFIAGDKLLPIERFLPKPPGEKVPRRGGGARGGRGGGRGGRGAPRGGGGRGGPRGGSRGFSRGGGGGGGRASFRGAGGSRGGGFRGGGGDRGGGFRGGGGRGGRGRGGY